MDFTVFAVMADPSQGSNMVDTGSRPLFSSPPIDPDSANKCSSQNPKTNLPKISTSSRSSTNSSLSGLRRSPRTSVGSGELRDLAKFAKGQSKMDLMKSSRKGSRHSHKSKANPAVASLNMVHMDTCALADGTLKEKGGEDVCLNLETIYDVKPLQIVEHLGCGGLPMIGMDNRQVDMDFEDHLDSEVQIPMMGMTGSDSGRLIPRQKVVLDNRVDLGSQKEHAKQLDMAGCVLNDAGEQIEGRVCFVETASKSVNDAKSDREMSSLGKNDIDEGLQIVLDGDEGVVEIQDMSEAEYMRELAGAMLKVLDFGGLRGK